MKKRMVSLILILSLLCTMLPSTALTAFAENEDDTVVGLVLLETATLSDPEDETYPGGAMVIATKNTSVQERGCYIITLQRLELNGQEASVNLQTVDISAIYGQDYEILSGDGVKTDDYPKDENLAQQGLSKEREKKGKITGRL